MKIYVLYIEQTIEYEYENNSYKFYLTEEEMHEDRLRIERHNKQPDGKWIPNITSMSFDESSMSFEDAKSLMTVAEFESLFNKHVDDLFREETNK